MAHQLNLNSSALEELKAKAAALPAEKKIQDNKIITPTTIVQTISPDAGYDGFGSVTVNAIPDGISGGNIDLSEVTAQEKYVRQGDIFVDANGDKKTGKLNVNKVQLGVTSIGYPYTVPASVDYDGMEFTPTNAEEFYTSVNANFGTANAEHVLEGHTFTTDNFFSNGWNHFELAAQGTMPNNGDTSKTIDGLNTKTVTIPEGYTSGGTITVDDTVGNIVDTQADLLTQIQNALQGKSVPSGTCTVIIRPDVEPSYSTYINRYAFQTSDGIKSFISEYSDATPLIEDIVIENVICGSLCVIDCSSKNAPDQGVYLDQKMEYITYSSTGYVLGIVGNESRATYIITSTAGD